MTYNLHFIWSALSNAGKKVYSTTFNLEYKDKNNILLIIGTTLYMKSQYLCDVGHLWIRAARLIYNTMISAY